MHISNTLKSILRGIGDDVSNDILTSQVEGKGDYLGTRSGWFTYLPNGKPVDKPYASRNRVRTTPAKAARRFCTQQHTDKEYEDFHNSFQGRAFTIQNLGIVKGDDIPKVYNDWYDRRRQSRQVTSCMTDSPTYRFELYTKFPESVRMIVVWDQFRGKKVVVARALMWKTNEGIFVDRVYGSDVAKKFLQTYCLNKGWLMFSGWGDRGEYEYSIKDIFVNLVGNRPNNLPYLDTFNFESDGRVSTLKGVARCPTKIKS